MSVDGHGAVVGHDPNPVPIPLGGAGVDHDPVGGGEDRGAHRVGDVDAREPVMLWPAYATRSVPWLFKQT